MTTPTLNATATAAALPFAALVPALARAMQELAAGHIHAPERLVVPMAADGVLLCMPASASDVSVCKTVTVHPRNAEHHLPAIQGEVMVMDTASGQRLLQLDGPTVTARRTAAVTLLGIQTLLGRQPERVLLTGTGAQAHTHAAALVDFFGVPHIAVAGTTLAKAQVFCSTQQGLFPQTTWQALPPLEQNHLQPHPAWQLQDVVIALTTSRTPVIPAHLSPGTLAIGVGAFRPDMAEFPASLLHSRTVVVDCLKGARHEAGDLLRAAVDWSRVQALSSLLPPTPHTTGTPVPVFKTVGQAAWDLAAARVALALATVFL